jgi:low affinity Fe/Cu permease
MSSVRDTYRRIAKAIAAWSGSPVAAGLACAFVVLWLLSGPRFHFSEFWQLVMNTVSSVVTFLMVFLIQYTQNRETLETQLKLNELIRAVADARNELIALDDLTDEQLLLLHEDLLKWSERHGVQVVNQGRWNRMREQRRAASATALQTRARSVEQQ